MQKIHCISGLGADHRVFRNLQVPGYELVSVPWLPALKHDTLPSYAARMFHTIQGPDPIILGLSFGGMLTTEIKKQFGISRAFIVSSARTRAEIGYTSGIFRWASRMHVIPDVWLAEPPIPVLFMLGAVSDEERELVSDMMLAGSPLLSRWMVDALLNWDNRHAPEGIVHIHGTADKVIRPENVHPTHWVNGGSHFMIYNRAGEVSDILTEMLK